MISITLWLFVVRFLIIDQLIDQSIADTSIKPATATTVTSYPSTASSIPASRSSSAISTVSGSAPTQSVSIVTVDQNSVSGSAPPAGQAQPSPSSPDAEISREIVKSLISSLVPGAAASISGPGANAQLNPFNFLPMLSKLSTPIAHLIASNGKPSVEDIDQLLKAAPEVAVLLGMAGMLGANGIPGLKVGDPGAPAINFSNMTPQQINDLISGAAPLPPINALPPDYVRTVLAGGALPGLTIEQTQALKQRYTQQMFGGGGGAAPGSIPLIGNVYANISASQSITISKSSTSDSTMQELKNLDLSQLPPDVIRSFLAGETPDLNKIPQDFLNSLVNKSPRLFANIVSSALRKKISNESITLIGDQNGSIPIDQGSATPYDVNSLDRKADISMYHQGDDDHQAALWTAIVLAIVGLLMAILIGVLCWRRQRNRRLMEDREGVLAPSSIRIDPKSAVHSTVIDETEEARDNRRNARAEATIGRWSVH